MALHRALRSPRPVGYRYHRVVKAPGKAQASGMGVALQEKGEFTGKEGAQTLAAVVAEVPERGEPDTGEDYYRHWLTALERNAQRKGLVTQALLEERRHAWEEAAHGTPHGPPIEVETRP